jgi:hydrogenase-4 component B
MSLWLVVCAISVLFASAAAAALAGRRDRFALLVGTAGAVAGSLLGAAGSLIALFSGRTAQVASAWPLALGTLRVGIDALSAFFLLCVFVVSGLAAVYAAGYFGDLAGRRLAAPVALMNALAGAMVGVVIARDGVVFLAAWETMALASFFLVLLHGERAETRKAAIVYLVASHAGALPLFVLFVLLADNAGSFDFAVMRAAAPAAPLAGTCFLLALAGFGAKAGFWPMHVWLPDAHPAAPSPVSAVMSGVMIKMGVYGLGIGRAHV